MAIKRTQQRRSEVTKCTVLSIIRRTNSFSTLCERNSVSTRKDVEHGLKFQANRRAKLIKPDAINKFARLLSHGRVCRKSTNFITL